MIFDKLALESFAKRAKAKPIAGADFLLDHALQELQLRLKMVKHGFKDAFSFGFGGQAVEKLLNDCAIAEQFYRRPQPAKDYPFGSQNYDLFISLYGLYPQNDLEQLLRDIHISLKSNGLLIGVIPGENCLLELKTSLLEAEISLYGGASPRVYPFLDLQSVGNLLQTANFSMPVVDVETIEVHYNDLFHLIADLRAMGAQNALYTRSRRPASKRFFALADAIYKEKFATNTGKIIATFSVIWFSGWRA